MKLICDLVRTFAGVISGMEFARATLRSGRNCSRWSSLRPGGIGGWDGMPAPLPRSQRPEIMAAIGGIDIALWTQGQGAQHARSACPAARAPRSSPTQPAGYYREGEPLERQAEEYARFVADGYRAVKLKTGALSLADEVTRIRFVREATGLFKLMLDMNAPYDVAGCIRFAEAVAPHDIPGWRSRCIGYPACRLRAPRRGIIDPAGALRTRMASLARFATSSTGAIGFVQFDSTAPPASPNRCASRTMRSRRVS